MCPPPVDHERDGTYVPAGIADAGKVVTELARAMGAELMVAGGYGHSRTELDDAIVECEQVAGDLQTMGLTFVVTQVCGRKPV